MDVKVLISHAHDEKALAEAWKNLLDTISLGQIEVWFSSDVTPGGGIDAGVEWRDQLYGKMLESNFIIALQTPSSAGRPWIMWECGAASGINKERGIIPIVFSMGQGDLANPLSSYQVYQGEDKSRVRELCNRLVVAAGLRWQEMLFEMAVESYLNAVSLHRPRRALGTEQMALWKTRFEELVRLGREAEATEMRRTMYATFGSPFKPVEPTLHELLSKILLDHKHYREAIEEIDYAVSLVGEDVELLRRKALALVQMHNLPGAEEIIGKIFKAHPDLMNNPELASLEGRIQRENWQLTNDRGSLDKAFAAYHRACQADQTQYYPCINAASLALAKDDPETANALFATVLNTCRELQQRPVVSYWVDFTAGEAQLGMGKIEEALASYKAALRRTPPPSPRDKESALNGAHRMAQARGLDARALEELEQLLLNTG